MRKPFNKTITIEVEKEDCTSEESVDVEGVVYYSHDTYGEDADGNRGVGIVEIGCVNIYTICGEKIFPSWKEEACLEYIERNIDDFIN
jgi:hypothetical protein